MTPELLYDVQDKIAHIQINRPRQLNSINPPLMAEISGLRQAIDYGVEAGAALDATATETNRKFEEIRAREGLPAAIRWRESQFE